MICLPKRSGLNIVLYEPEIPANTGNIGRLCVGTGSVLHVIRPFKFLMDDKSLKRAGLDYWPLLQYHVWEDWSHFCSSISPAKLWLCTTKSSITYTSVEYTKGDYLVFGPESRGLPPEILGSDPRSCITIPMNSDIRSINLSNSVAIILYEAVRQLIPSY